MINCPTLFFLFLALYASIGILGSTCQDPQQTLEEFKFKLHCLHNLLVVLSGVI